MNQLSDDDSGGSEEFFDAEESLPINRYHTKKRSPKKGLLDERFEFPDIQQRNDPSDRAASSTSASTSTATPTTMANKFQRPTMTIPMSSAQSHEFLEPKTVSRHRFRELRQCLQHDDDEQPGGSTLTPDSQNSSIEGVFPAQQRPTHPFRIIEQDAMSVQSMSSLGRVGRILSGSIDAQSISGGGGGGASSSTIVYREPTPTGSGPSASSLSPSAQHVAPMRPEPVQQQQHQHQQRQSNPVETNEEQQQQQQPRRIQLSMAEPDVIASTKLAQSKTTDSLKTTNTAACFKPVADDSSSVAASAAAATTSSATSIPVAPPRRKKRQQRKISHSGSYADETPTIEIASPFPFPETEACTLFQPVAVAATSIGQSAATAVTTSTTTTTTTTAKPPPMQASSSTNDAFRRRESTASPAQQLADTEMSPSRSAPSLQYPLELSSPATAAIASLTRDIENSFTEMAARASLTRAFEGAGAGSKYSSTRSSTQTLGNSAAGGGGGGSLIYTASNASAKSNSAPGRASMASASGANTAGSSTDAIDPTQGLNLYKATRGLYVVKPQDEAANKAEGPSLEEIERVERIRAEMAELAGATTAAEAATAAAAAGGGGGGQRAQIVPGIGTHSLGYGGGVRFSTSAARLVAAAQAAQAANASPLARANTTGGGATGRERRKSAGDEDVLRQLNVAVRTRTASGKQLSDFQILEQVPVKNLDTGERMPLSVMKPPPVPAGWNPLSLHIHKLTQHLDPMLAMHHRDHQQQKESDDESVCGLPAESELERQAAAAGGAAIVTAGPIGGGLGGAIGTGGSGGAGGGGGGGSADADDDSAEDGSGSGSGRLRRRTARFKRFIGSTMRKTVDRAKLIASEVSHARHKEDVADVIDVVNPEQQIKVKASSTNKGPYEFAKLQHVQDLSGSEHTGAVWCMKFSSCGRLLATAGQDRVLRIWVLREAYAFFQDMRTKYNADQKASPTPSQESLVSHQSTSIASSSADDAVAMLAQAADAAAGPFMPRAFCTYTGHTSDLLDVSWSKNYFILSSSMDKTVRLWHISRRECLCCFQHIDFVTAIAFHPRDDRYFLSGSLDGKLRLWNIPDKKVALWNEVDGQTKLITAANFCQNGKFAVVGTYDGRCIFYNTDQLKYHTQIHVRSTRGRNKTGRKISGIEPMPGEDKILVTSNDSRIRLYDLRDLNLSCKYKGYANVSSQIKASFSNDGKYIVAGSENQCIYIWKTNHDYSKLSSVRRDRSDFWEGIKAHNATVTCAIFAPNPEAILRTDPAEDDNISRITQNSAILDPMAEQRKKSSGYVLISADFNGAIKVFINRMKPKHSSLPYTAVQD